VIGQKLSVDVASAGIRVRRCGEVFCRLGLFGATPEVVLGFEGNVADLITLYGKVSVGVLVVGQKIENGAFFFFCPRRFWMHSIASLNSRKIKL
jgi:hypothetical protein